MNKPTTEELAAFLNALQISIQSELANLIFNGAQYRLHFKSVASQDPHRNAFEKLVPGTFEKKSATYTFHLPPEMNWPLLTNFLLLTRLQKENMQALVGLNPGFECFAKPLGISPSSTQIRSIQDAAKIIFDKIKEKKMTLREVSEKSGLTQMALNRFKSGNDIRLSSLLKITQAIGIKLNS